MTDSHTNFDTGAFAACALGGAATLASALIAGVGNLRRAQEAADYGAMALADARAHASFESLMRIRAVAEHVETARRVERLEIENLELERNVTMLLAQVREARSRN